MAAINQTYRLGLESDDGMTTWERRGRLVGHIIVVTVAMAWRLLLAAAAMRIMGWL